MVDGTDAKPSEDTPGRYLEWAAGMDLQMLQDYLWPFMSSRRAFPFPSPGSKGSQHLASFLGILWPVVFQAVPKQGSDLPPFDNDLIDILRPGVGNAWVCLGISWGPCLSATSPLLPGDKGPEEDWTAGSEQGTPITGPLHCTGQCQRNLWCHRPSQQGLGGSLELY